MIEQSIVEHVGVGVAGLLALVFTLQKLMSFWKKERSEQSGSDATTSQFKAFQEAIDQHTKELESLRSTVMTMDRTIHKQQRTITRLEMLVLQLKGLQAMNGVKIPNHIQAEIDELIREHN